MLEAALNFVGLQVGWFAGVGGAARGRLWLGPVVMLPLVAWHLSRAEQPAREATFLLLATAVGCLACLWVSGAGLVRYEGRGSTWWRACPLWIVCLWLLFATTFHGSLAWLEGRPLLALALGCVGGPLSDLAGVKMGAASFPDPRPRSFAVLSATWGAVILLLSLLAALFTGEGGRT
jgi:hypothetical protein